MLTRSATNPDRETAQWAAQQVVTRNEQAIHRWLAQGTRPRLTIEAAWPSREEPVGRVLIQAMALAGRGAVDVRAARVVLRRELRTYARNPPGRLRLRLGEFYPVPDIGLPEAEIQQWLLVLADHIRQSIEEGLVPPPAALPETHWEWHARFPELGQFLGGWFSQDMPAEFEDHEAAVATHGSGLLQSVCFQSKFGSKIPLRACGADMARIISLRAPESIGLHDMSQQQIEAYVSDVATRALDSLPEGVKPVGVNAVEIESLLSASDSERGGLWAQWTRACCAQRADIEDFEPPVLEEFTAPGSTVHRDASRTHVESMLRTAALEYPDMHGESGG